MNLVATFIRKYINTLSIFTQYQKTELFLLDIESMYGSNSCGKVFTMFLLLLHILVEDWSNHNPRAKQHGKRKNKGRGAKLISVTGMSINWTMSLNPALINICTETRDFSKFNVHTEILNSHRKSNQRPLVTPVMLLKTVWNMLKVNRHNNVSYSLFTCVQTMLTM